MRSVKVGVALPHYDFSFPDHRAADLDSVVEFAIKVESLGYDSVWVSDHFFLDLSKYGGSKHRYGALEPLTVLAAIAPETERVRLGTLVLCEAFRPPPLVAKMASTLDLISGGRVDVGMGAGWYEDEFVAAGIPFPAPAERIARLAEAIQVVGGMLERTPFSFAGRHYRAVDAPNEPQPVQRPRPPVWVGGKGGPGLMRVIASHADGWNLSWRTTPQAYESLLSRLDEACERVSRDRSTVRLSLGQQVLVGKDQAQLRARADALVEWAPAGEHPDQYRHEALVGTPGDIAGRIGELEALGVESIVLTFSNLPFAVFDEEQVEEFAAEVLPKVR
jgi:probable F420-dependent oxidoreductase